MKVKQRMSRKPVIATPETTHREAVELLRKHNVRRLPVVDKSGKLVGIVTQSDILSTSPSPATTLSVYEIITLLDRLTLEQFMSRPVLAVNEECDIANAARFMIEHKISALPIVRGEKLVGIITETDIFKTFVEIMGGMVAGARFEVEVPDRKGMLAAVAQAVANADGNIVSVSQHPAENPGNVVLEVKERGAIIHRLRDELGKVNDAKVLDFRAGEDDTLLKIE
jgi:acetoin utilization protein AcuB